MVVLAASICTRGGKPLLSRQFRDLSKDRITALLSNFPSLISNSDSQNTTVEDESVRFVYQPLEEFYIVLLTNKSSNILQDIDTLHLFASTISNMLRNIDEREIFDNSFEIISAFDEIVSLGFKENLTLSQVQTFLEMDSHEEKIQEMIERNKELEATEERKRRAKEIQRKELARRNLEQFPPGNSSFGYDSYQNTQLPQSYQPTYQASPSVESHTEQSSLSSKPLGPRGGGLQLGKKPQKSTEGSQPLLTSNTSRFAAPSASNQTASPSPYPQQPQEISKPASPAPPKVHNNGILVTINEKVSASLNRDGSIVSSEVKGDLQLRINDPSLANAKILLKVGEKSCGIQYKTHPHVDRNLFNSSSIIGLKDKEKTFPSNDQALGVLRWRVVGKTDETSYLPILITVWTNVNDGIAEFTLEYELTSEFLEANSHRDPEEALIEDLKIFLPIPSSEGNLQSESDNVSYEVSEYGIIFNISSIKADSPQGSFEYSVPAVDEDSLFPLELQFNINNTSVTESDISLGKVQVVDIVSNNEEEDSLPFDLHSVIASENYVVN